MAGRARAGATTWSTLVAIRALMLLVALAAAACGGSDAPPPPPVVEMVARLVAGSESLAVRPSQSALVTYRLVDETGAPLPDRIIQFSIVDDPGTTGDEARGSTLSYDRGVTDANGAATLQVIAG